MAICPHCDDEIEAPNPGTLLTDEFFGDDFDVSLSGQQHVQLECPECESVLGYLGLAAATGD